MARPFASPREGAHTNSARWGTREKIIGFKLYAPNDAHKNEYYNSTAVALQLHQSTQDVLYMPSVCSTVGRAVLILHPRPPTFLPLLIKRSIEW